MGEIVKFPTKRHSNKKRPPENQTHSQKSTEPEEASWIISAEDDEAFLHLLSEWPCFQGFQPQSLQQLFDLYYGDKLSMAQDCVIEFMLHMHDADSSFDIGHALYTWGEEDKDFFLVSLSMHAELIATVRKEEM